MMDSQLLAASQCFKQSYEQGSEKMHRTTVTTLELNVKSSDFVGLRLTVTGFKV